MPRIDADLKLDFKDVLLRPKRSSLKSRAEVRLPESRLGGRVFSGVARGRASGRRGIVVLTLPAFLCPRVAGVRTPFALPPETGESPLVPCQDRRCLQEAQQRPKILNTLVGVSRGKLMLDHRGAAIQRPNEQEDREGIEGCTQEKRTRGSQVVKGDDKQWKILVTLAVSLSAENCCWVSIRSSNK